MQKHLVLEAIVGVLALSVIATQEPRRERTTKDLKLGPLVFLHPNDPHLNNKGTSSYSSIPNNVTITSLPPEDGTSRQGRSKKIIIMPKTEGEMRFGIPKIYFAAGVATKTKMKEAGGGGGGGGGGWGASGGQGGGAMMSGGGQMSGGGAMMGWGSQGGMMMGGGGGWGGGQMSSGGGAMMSGGGGGGWGSQAAGGGAMMSGGGGGWGMQGGGGGMAMGGGGWGQKPMMMGGGGGGWGPPAQMSGGGGWGGGGGGGGGGGSSGGGWGGESGESECPDKKAEKKAAKAKKKAQKAKAKAKKKAEKKGGGGGGGGWGGWGRTGGEENSGGWSPSGGGGDWEQSSVVGRVSNDKHVAWYPGRSGVVKYDDELKEEEEVWPNTPPKEGRIEAGAVYEVDSSAEVPYVLTIDEPGRSRNGSTESGSNSAEEGVSKLSAEAVLTQLNDSSQRENERLPELVSFRLVCPPDSPASLWFQKGQRRHQRRMPCTYVQVYESQKDTKIRVNPT